MARSLPAWGVWIEIMLFAAPSTLPLSLPAWGVWIEMLHSWTLTLQTCAQVTPCLGSVD